MGSMDSRKELTQQTLHAEPIIAPILTETLENELLDLSEFKLLEQADFEVYCAPTPKCRK